MLYTGLRAFHAVAVQGSFTGAGGALGVSQPTVSGQVRALEARYGVRLFERRGRRVEPTGLREQRVERLALPARGGRVVFHRGLFSAGQGKRGQATTEQQAALGSEQAQSQGAPDAVDEVDAQGADIKTVEKGSVACQKYCQGPSSGPPR